MIGSYIGKTSAISQSRRASRLSVELKSGSQREFSKLPPISQGKLSIGSCQILDCETSSSILVSSNEETPIFEEIPVILSTQSTNQIGFLCTNSSPLPSSYCDNFPQLLENKIVICKNTSFDESTESIKEFTKKTFALSEIKQIFESSDIIAKIDDRILIRIREMTEKNLFFPHIERAILCVMPEERPSIEMKERLHIEACCAILESLVSLDRKSIIFPERWHRKLFSVHGIPDPHTHDSLIRFWNQYYISFPDRRDDIMYCSMSCLYINRCEKLWPYQIIPVLLFLNRVFRALNKSISKEWVNQSVQFVIPLLSTSHVFWYSPHLLQLIGSIVLIDSFKSMKILYKMIKIWPTQSSMKQQVFLEILSSIHQSLLIYINKDTIRVFSSLFMILGPCIESLNSKTSQLASTFVSDFILNSKHDLTSLYLAFIQNSLNFTINHHWCDVAKTVATTSYRNIEQKVRVSKGNYSKTEIFNSKERLLKKKRNDWLTILNTAFNEDAIDNDEEYKISINNTFTDKTSKYESPPSPNTYSKRANSPIFNTRSPSITIPLSQKRVVLI